MGKMRKRSRRGKRPNPVGIPSMQELLGEEEDSPESLEPAEASFITTILDQLRSHTVEERDSGLNSLAAAAAASTSSNNKALLELLLKEHEIVKVVGPLLNDTSVIVRHSAAGALRNMSSTEDVEISELMISQGVMTHLALLFERHYTGEWEPRVRKPSGTSGGGGAPKAKSIDNEGGESETHSSSSSSNTNTNNGSGVLGVDRIDSITDTFIQAAHLLTHLCEKSEGALKALSRHKDMVQVVAKGLNVEKYGSRVALAAAHFLNVVTEESPKKGGGAAAAAPIVELAQVEGFLQKILTSSASSPPPPPPLPPTAAECSGPSSSGGGELNRLVYLQTLSVGILLNLQKGGALHQGQVNNNNLTLTLCLRVLKNVMEMDHVAQLKGLSSQIPIIQGPSSGAGNGNANGEAEAMETDEVAGGGGRRSAGAAGAEFEGSAIIEEKIQEVAALLSAQTLALEILSNMLFLDDDDEEEEEGESVSGEESPVEEDVVEGVEAMEEECNGNSPTGLSSQVFEMVASEKVGDSVLKLLLTLPPTNVIQLLSEYPPSSLLVEALVHLRCRSLISYQNLIVGLSTEQLGGGAQLEATFEFTRKLLVEVGERVWGGCPVPAAAAGAAVEEELEAATCVVRAILEKWVAGLAGEDNSSVSSVAATFFAQSRRGELERVDFTLFWKLYHEIEVAKVQTNVIKIFGCFGLLVMRLALQEEKKNSGGGIEACTGLLVKVAEFLLSCLNTTTVATTQPGQPPSGVGGGSHGGGGHGHGGREKLWRAAEALDTLFDLFSEDEFNHVLVQLKLIQKLQLFAPQFNKLIRMHRRELGEQRAIVETAKLNLSRFIQYKVKHGCSS